MRKLLLLALIFSGLSMSAQRNEIDPRLEAKFSQEQLQNMPEARIAYWNYYLDHSFEIMDIAEEKADYLQELEVIGVASSDFHGLSITLDTYQKEGAYLRFKGEDKMVVIKPIDQFIQEFNQYYQNSKR